MTILIWDSPPLVILLTFSQSVIAKKTLAVSSEIENLLSLLETMRHVENMPEVKFTSPFIMK